MKRGFERWACRVGPICQTTGTMRIRKIKSNYADERLLLGSSRAESPLSGISASVHDNSLGLGDDTVVTTSDIGSGHLSNSQGDSFTLGGDQNDLLSNLWNGLDALSQIKYYYFDVRFELQDTGNHELSTVADGINATVLNDNTRVRGQKDFHGHNDLSQGRFVLKFH